MVFDKSKDTVYMEKVFSTAKEGETLTIGVYSYNGGAVKLRPVRIGPKKNKGTGLIEIQPTKLAGFTAAEAIAIRDTFNEAVDMCARLQQNNAAPTPVTQPTAPQVPVAPQMPTMTPIAPAAQPLPPHAVAQPVAPNTIRRIQI